MADDDNVIPIQGSLEWKAFNEDVGIVSKRFHELLEDRPAALCYMAAIYWSCEKIARNHFDQEDWDGAQQIMREEMALQNDEPS